MLEKLCLFFFVYLTTNVFVQGFTPQKLSLTVYYESKCPDSRAFVLHQLVPTMRLISEHIALELVPFGKARSKNHGYDGFACQHGQPECVGNMVQSCALDLMKGRTDADKVEYLACEFQTYASTRGDFSCVQKANVHPDSVFECLKSGRGTQLQLNAEYLTQQVKPRFIPTVTVNNIFNQQIQDSAQMDLIGTLCSILKETPQCAQRYNSMAMRYLFS